ncbi:MAG: GAF domain-containing protein [Alphaproteobacteria bacterium]|nr:GAF domain-containing protein [Alphaproteobacteria bacterium]
MPAAGSLGGKALRLPLFLLLGVLVLLAMLASLFNTEPEWGRPISVFQLGLIAAAAGLTLFLEGRIRRNLLEPLAQLRDWARRMRAGNLTARIPEPEAEAFRELAHDVNGVGEMVSGLSLEMEERVQKATRRIAHKTRSLEILCDVAATINTSRDINQLLKKFLEIVSELVEARGGLVRLLTRDGQLRLVASDGLDEEIVGRERLVAVGQCACGRAVSGRSLQCHGAELCRGVLGRPIFAGDDGMEMVAVPLTYRGRVLGIYNLFLERPLPFPREDLNDLLKNIGRHLGMAIEKARLDEEAKRLSLMEERTLLAHELHDSLAQTLSSLRFQVRTLDDTLQAGDQPAIQYNLSRITNSLDEAHRELRELLAQFRAPMDQSGLVKAVEKVVDGFGHDSGIDIFFQQEWHDTRLPVNVEVQILRIVQEALANVRKHGQAHHVRVILHHDETKNACWVLIEDDGVGFTQTDMEGRPGEHLGLSIMEDRARRVGGSLRIESEVGEGTRVMLAFPLSGAAEPPIRATG